MKNRVRAILLAAGMALLISGFSASAAENATEGAVEVLTEAEENTAQEDPAQAEGEETSSARDYEQLKKNAELTMQGLSDMPEAAIAEAMESSNPARAAMAAQWDSVREELGQFQGVTDQEIIEDGKKVTIRSIAQYSGTPANTTVNVEYTMDYGQNDPSQAESIAWDIHYPMSKMMKEAALNTLMGLGIVFAVLVFLSFVINRMGVLANMGGKKKEEKPAAAPAPVKAAPAAVEEAEEDLTDDLELVAVIAAAIAASENTSADGFVVRSIKKVNRRKWQSA